MKRKRYNIELTYYFVRKYLYIFVVIILSLFCLKLLIENNSDDKNVFDLFIALNGFLSISYFIIPIFLLILTSHFSHGKIQNYLAFRFKNKRHWYYTNVLYVAQLTLVFIVIIVAIILMQSLFVLNFENKWSDFARDYYVYHTTFLENFRPLTYSIFTILLLGQLLFLLGLIFCIITIWTNKPLVSLLIVMLLNIINIAVTIGKLETFSPFLFTNHLDLMNYMYMTESDQSKFPFGITVYWFLLIAIVYLIGYFFTNKVDFDVEKGEKLSC